MNIPESAPKVTVAAVRVPLARHVAGIERDSLFLLIGSIVLMQTHALDGFMFTGISYVMQLFALLLSPLTFFLN